MPHGASVGFINGRCGYHYLYAVYLTWHPADACHKDKLINSNTADALLVTCIQHVFPQQPTCAEAGNEQAISRTLVIPDLLVHQPTRAEVAE